MGLPRHTFGLFSKWFILLLIHLSHALGCSVPRNDGKNHPLNLYFLGCFAPRVDGLIGYRLCHHSIHPSTN